MRVWKRALSALFVLPMLTGCVLLKSTPTPLPVMRTATLDPTATSGSWPTLTPPPSPPTAPIEQGPVEQQIILESPLDGEPVRNPLTVRGRTTVMPFEATLVVRIYDAHGALVSETPIKVQGKSGGPATFEAGIAYGNASGVGRVEVAEVSPYDGSDLAVTGVSVALSSPASSAAVEIPAASERVTLPMRILARVGQPGTQVNVTLAWADGTELTQMVTLLAGQDGRGLLITSLDWVTDPHPPYPRTQRATLRIADPTGQQLAQQLLVVLHPDDPDTLGVRVYWVRDNAVEPQPLRIPRTPGIGRASLEALLWGPVPGSPAGYTTAIPLPQEVLVYAGGAGWGERVRLNKLTIENGVARADFSREMLANPGGAARMTLIRQQIAQTLLQFSTVDQVVITVEGRSGRLEP